jgi:hypothetical protein
LVSPASAGIRRELVRVTSWSWAAEYSAAYCGEPAFRTKLAGDVALVHTKQCLEIRDIPGSVLATVANDRGRWFQRGPRCRCRLRLSGRRGNRLCSARSQEWVPDVVRSLVDGPPPAVRLYRTAPKNHLLVRLKHGSASANASLSSAPVRIASYSNLRRSRRQAVPGRLSQGAGVCCAEWVNWRAICLVRAISIAAPSPRASNWARNRGFRRVRRRQ